MFAVEVTRSEPQQRRGQVAARTRGAIGGSRRASARDHAAAPGRVDWWPTVDGSLGGAPAHSSDLAAGVRVDVARA
jgi:hypothetical protein